MKILVVDDNAENRYLLEVLLKTHDHTVVTAGNGFEALERLQREPIDLIISDILMPKMDGYRLCRECKQNDRLRDIPFVFITSSYTEEKDEQFALGLGAERFIRRPIEPDAFMRIIDEVITRAAAKPPAHLVEADYMANYIERVVNKLEEKIAALEAEVAARKRAEEALRESEERYRSLTAALVEGVILMDAEGTIQACNASAERMLGLTLGQTDRAVFDPRSPPIDEDGTPYTADAYPQNVTLQTGEPCRNVTMGLPGPDGSVTWLSVNAQPLSRAGMDKPYAVVASFADITEQKLLEQELEHQARVDALTGVANRRHFMDEAEQGIALSRRYGHVLSLLMLDIDRFKLVNDTYGHHVGDIVLQALAEVCRRELRDVDVFGRIGGEEFAVLLPETGAERALRVAERLRQAVAAAAVRVEERSNVRFTVSIGVATLTDADGCVDTLLQRADQALYEAKESGRNAVRAAVAATAPEAAMDPLRSL
jgi:diguanylate cyclase (GGDEF)-like protein/PAS domain S-box-containing protein